MKSRVHPRYKTKYRVGNWPAYDRALVQRGDVTLWLTPEAIATWEAVGVGKRGGQLQYSEVAIETALTLRLIFHLPLRQTEGFLRSIVGMLCLDLSAPDHTTLSRRGQHLDLALRRLPAGAGIHLIVDRTGLSTVGEGEWAAVKHGGRGIRGWKKLHLGVDGSGVIVAHALTGGHVDDATTALDLIDKVEGDVSCLTADAAYDTRGIYEAAGARGATVVIPPTRTATVSGRRPRSPARDRTIRQVQQAGRRQWKKDSGYHQQARVENAFFRYKLIIGESLRARGRAGQETEAILACNILNQMTQLGRPASVRYRSLKGLWVGDVAGQFSNRATTPTIAGRENSIGTKPVEKLGSKPKRITDRATTPIGSHSESFSVRLMRTELTTACRAPPLRERPPHVAEEKTGPTAAGVSERFSAPCSFARRMQDIESDTGYDTRRRAPDGALARLS